MSKHDCRMSGVLTLQPGVTREQIYEAFRPYLEMHKLSHNLSDDAPRPEPGDDPAVELDEPAGQVFVQADFRGYGGYLDEHEELAAALAPLVDGPQVLEFEDFDSGSIEDALCPLFFGPTPQDGKRAQLRYAADAFARWVGFAPLEQLVRSLVEHYPVEGMLGMETPAKRPAASGVLRTDLLVTVMHEASSGLQLANMALSDIHMEIDTGSSIGRVRELHSRELADFELRGELLAVGNDGQFFATVDELVDLVEAGDVAMAVKPAAQLP